MTQLENSKMFANFHLFLESSPIYTMLPPREVLGYNEVKCKSSISWKFSMDGVLISNVAKSKIGNDHQKQAFFHTLCAVKPSYETTCCDICLISNANLH